MINWVIFLVVGGERKKKKKKKNENEKGRRRRVRERGIVKNSCYGGGGEEIWVGLKFFNEKILWFFF